MRIIIIDDNPAIHQDFIKILTANKSSSPLKNSMESLENQLFNKTSQADKLPNFAIDTASQGQEGVQLIDKAFHEGSPYSLAFVDIRMPPGWDGIETIKHIWEIDKNIQVVICTAYSDYTWEQTVDELGVNDNLIILKKPFDNIAVRQLACALTKKWQLLQESISYTSSLESRIEERTEDLKYQATHDSLTGLPNRMLMLDRLHMAIASSDRNNAMFAVLFLDLDRFKLINDSLSHNAGDEVLRHVSNRLQSALREEDTLVRLGGDEFVVIIQNIKNSNDASEIATKLLNTFHDSLYINERKLSITTSIGISLYPQDGKNIDTLLRNADIAMYHAKERGTNQYQFYKSAFNAKSLDRLEQEEALRQAIANHEFFLSYQPQFDFASQRLVSVEALIRWNHPTKGVVLPIDFIPLAEEAGLIVQIGEWVLRAACKQNKQWQEQGLPHIRVAVNITTKQIRLYNIVDIVKNALSESRLDPEYLEIELTENTVINNACSIKAIKDLKEIGIQIALDDFGSGYSSLNYLREIPVDRLKIDQSFVQNIDSNRGDGVIIQAIITMAHHLNLEVLAEGVETKKQYDFLKEQKCGEFQGFYFSKPISSSECEAMLRKSSPILAFDETSEDM
ncbi:MAG TPA: EAL domain-containing protein [Gammaproteobacteria bacterium]|nr:EAL domain-containing protein [Gammaproteobacteria bacterium]